MDGNTRGLIKFSSFLRHVSEDTVENYEISEDLSVSLPIMGPWTHCEISLLYS